MSKAAKLFMNGRSQAVRLPANCRFEGDEVFIHRDSKSGDVILSAHPDSWDDFFNLLQTTRAPEDFLNHSERSKQVDKKNLRDPLDGWDNV
ncbi:MAG: type II toxin-antitoxin system VapB family antitoxin [Legionellaceae bacterium]|nr:type II toxin-antitoxin system VapB family antitoxin [Legionellaceae bacterium]